MQVTSEELTFVARIVEELCGVVLDDSKAYLIENRLADLAKAAGCLSYTDLCQRARYSDPSLRAQLIDAITTHETSFFRDDSPFHALQYKALPELIDAKAKSPFPRRLRIWSAACSTGQEPYSIAMALAETIPHLASWDIGILATDVSDAAIKAASLGRYTRLEIERGMKPPLLNKYFSPQGNDWVAKDQLRAMVAFRKQNLLEPFVGLGPFDIIFCRNVAIYFDAATRRNLFLRLADRLTPEGYLFVGSAESLIDLGSHFAPHAHCRATYYRPQLATARHIQTATDRQTV
jgi:chemotaxis protein methyltransferase CheR